VNTFVVSSELLKWAALGLFALGLFALAYWLADDRESLVRRWFAQYVAYLERRLRSLFISSKGELVATAQLVVAVLVVGVGLLSTDPLWYALLIPVAALPVLVIAQARRRRVRSIESKLDAFILALANALRTTPNLGKALEYTQPLLAPPLDAEIELALKEIRVGSTLDQALLNVSARVRSATLDATLAALLIGRQVGGDLPRILETTAATLREMVRLQGVVRAKTAEGKVQLLVVALCPFVLLGGFDLLSPGYFNPLVESPVGWFVIAISIVAWILALMVARSVLKVAL
jgi:tight adherence protein B